MHSIQDHQIFFKEYLKTQQIVKDPKNLYDPVDYILQLGGKRLRPVLVLMASEVFGGDYKEALPAAMSIEVFHNFSLIHDDIMDEAPLRRGQATVHEKWDVNTGILSGDAMLILAYQFLEYYQGDVFKELTVLFSKTAKEVCEGQQSDMDFENRNDVTILEYRKMISYKTAVLVGAALQMGAIIAGVSDIEKDKIYEFGVLLGTAFQIQDDYLDAFGDPETFGKQVGGDIIENKKTFLYLKAQENAVAEDRQLLEQLFTSQPDDPTEKITKVKQIFETSGAKIKTREQIEVYTAQAFDILDTLKVPEENKAVLRAFGKQLMYRVN